MDAYVSQGMLSLQYIAELMAPTKYIVKQIPCVGSELYIADCIGINRMLFYRGVIKSLLSNDNSCEKPQDMKVRTYIKIHYFIMSICMSKMSIFNTMVCHLRGGETKL